MIILLIRGMSLPGADKGLAFLFKPDIDKIWSIPVSNYSLGKESSIFH